METSAVSRLMPFVFGRMLKKECAQFFDPAKMKSILKSTRQEYKEILIRIPAMGGKENSYIFNMYFGAYLTAFYKQVRSNITLEQLREVIFNIVRKAMSKKKGNSNLSSDKARQKRIAGAEWAKQNKTRYPWTWQLEVKDNVKDRGTYFEFTNCGLCILCKAEGVPELTPVMCATDFVMAEAAGYTLERTKTLAGGDDCCDFWIY